MDKRNFIKTLGWSAGLFPLLGVQYKMPVAAQAEHAPLLPKPLNKGDLVGIISPSAATADEMQFRFASEAMEALGFQVVLGEHIANRRGHLAGSDEERAEDLNNMFAHQQVKAVVCIRGGSGAARILPLIDYENISRNPKPLLGYSDITALHNAIYARTGLITFHGPNGSGSWNSFNVNQFTKMFFDRDLVHFENELVKGDDLVIKENRIQTIFPGAVEGVIVGGNLTVLTALAGSPYLPDFKDKILFLEDTDEDPYRIDRMMSTLRLMGALNQIKGFIFGQCTGCDPSGGYGSLTLNQIFEDYILPLNIPAYRGAMIGHIPRQFIVPIGAKVGMDAGKGVFKMRSRVFQE
jgi:muramoyltetrapeptide carboxypeptidase